MKAALLRGFASLWLVSGLAACGGGGGGDAPAGTARAYQRTESEVTALPSGTGWTASRAQQR